MTERASRIACLLVATPASANEERDLCQVRVPELVAPRAKLNTGRVRVGQRVYAIGAPEGLELTLTEGLISSLREFDGSQYIQTSAAIARGLSGGGLFDTEARWVRRIGEARAKKDWAGVVSLSQQWVRAMPRDLQPGGRVSRPGSARQGAGCARPAAQGKPHPGRAVRKALYQAVNPAPGAVPLANSARCRYCSPRSRFKRRIADP
ncbi:MAG TPA: serine protease [Burkholderiales bacterium]